MKKKILTLLFVLIIGLASGKDSKIDFRNVSNFDEAIELSKKENKFLFLDCYTQWCGPCKIMDNVVFTHPNVASFYNENFICIKADMESEEWKGLAKKYPIYGYPSFLFIDQNEALQHSKYGGCPSILFVELGKKALDTSQNMLALKQKIDQGDRSAVTLYNYFQCNRNRDFKKQIISNFILNSTNEELFSKNAWNLITEDISYGDSIYNYFVLKHYMDYYPSVGEADVIKVIESKWAFKVYRHGSNLMKEKSKKEIRKTGHPLAERCIACAEVSIAGEDFIKKPNQRNKDGLENATQTYIKYLYKDWSALNEAAWSVYKTFSEVNDTILLKLALNWVDASIESNKNTWNLDTKANILSSLGENQKAIEIISEAVEIAKSGGQNAFSSVNELQRVLTRFEDLQKTTK
jgi:thioredoxin-related protein